MAFNKAKALENAQKFLNQGKLPQAITEYLQILRHEPNDQITLMTIGDLYVRAGEPQQALQYFEKLAQIFLSDGFNSKGIAIYKKIAKIAPEETRPLEKLGELYTQQGVMSEARPIYLQLAESHLKANRSQQAVEVLRKLLELEPDNQRVQLRLAELYLMIGQPQEAAHAFLNAAHRLIDRGQFADAEKMADRALAVDKKNTSAVMLKARALAAQGKSDDAIVMLENLDAGRASDATGLLVELYLQTGKASSAVELAKKAFARGPEHYVGVYDVAAALLDGGEPDAALGLLGEIRDAMTASGDIDRLAQMLSGVAERMPGRLEPLEWLAEVYRQSGNTFRLPEALDQLGEAAVSAGQLDKAAKAFEELAGLQPDEETTKRKLEQVQARLAGKPVPTAPAAAPAPAAVEELPMAFAEELAAVPATPMEEAPLDEETQRYVNQALTDVDLFSSYGMTQKAVNQLEEVLQRVPRHTGVLEKLLDLHLGAGNERRVAQLASVLEQIYGQRSDDAGAERFAELRRRFQRAAGMGAEEMPTAPPAEFAIPAVAEVIPVEEGEPAPAEPVGEVEAQPAEEAAVHEVDLSEEWASLSQLTAEAAPEAPAVPAEASAAPPAAEQPAEEIELSVEEEPLVLDQASAEPAPTEEAVELQPGPSEPAAEPASAAAGGISSEFLSDLAADLGDFELAPGPAEAARAGPPRVGTAQAGRPAAPAGKGSQLSEVFEEFRAELGEMGEEVEDPETHYNLGIAYREMGLLEEAIGEFQKVAKMLQVGRTFRYTMQCYTLLGISFMDKGQAGIAAVWYQKALTTPGLEQESVLALRYDLGVAQEMAGNQAAALDSFSQVYAMNIDYRDVAERIAALQKKH